jgi:iron complex outermembrane receptor protein
MGLATVSGATILIAGCSAWSAAEGQTDGGQAPVNQVTAFGSQSSARPSSAVASAEVGDIVVTARKREESIQRVPIAITAFSGADLRNKGVTSLADIGRFTPGLNAQPHPTAQSVVQFNMRGQSSGDVLTTIDQPVGVYMDGVYVSRARGLNAAFFDIQRIEVLKGPQGTLYGRNTTGGAISIFTRGADFDGLHGFVGGQIGQYSLVDANAAINIPIVDNKLAVRIAADAIKRDGFGHSAITSQDIGQDKNQQTFRASLLFKPADNLSLELKGQHYRSRENNAIWTLRYVIPTGSGVTEATIERTGIYPGQPGYDAASAATLAYLQNLAKLGTQDYDTNYTNVPQRDDNNVDNVGLTAKWDISDDVSLKSITGYRHFKVQSITDADATQFDIFNVGVGVGGVPIASGKPGSLSSNFTIPLLPGQTNRFFSEELNLGGQALNDRLTWLVGGYYSDESGEDDQQARSTPALVPLVFVNDGYRVTTRNWSVFTQDDFKLTDHLSITGGIRYTQDRKGLVSRLANFIPSTGYFQCGTGVTDPTTGAALLTMDRAACQTSNRKTFSGVSYLGSINWQVSQSTLLYARTARSFRSGSFQLRFPTLAPANPEIATDYEVGVKSEPFGHILRINAATFLTKYKNKQESTIITLPTGALATVIQNAADATLKGFEADLQLRPTHEFTFNATVAYLYGRYGSFKNALPVYGGAPVDASGERFATPPWSYTLSGRYERPTRLGDVGLQVDWSWTAGARPSSRLVNPNIPKSIIDDMVANASNGTYTNGRAALGLMNARLDFHIHSPDLVAALFVTNLLDHRYQYANFDASVNGGFFTGISGAPRMVGASLKYSFGDE